MAKDPFQQLRVLTNASKKGNKLTDCYRLLYKRELWQAPPIELNPKLAELVDQTILQLQNGSFRFGQCDQDRNDHEILLVSVIYKILTHAYPSCLPHPPSLHDTLSTVKKDWHEVQWCLVGIIEPMLALKYLIPALEKRILDKRFLLLIHQLLKSKILEKGKRKDRLFLKVFELFEGIVWNEWDCFIAGQMKQVGLANTSKEVKGLILASARYKREIIIGLCGSKLEVLHFNENIREFIESHMSNRYSLRVTHVKKRVDFAGYEIRRKNHLTLNASTNVLVQTAKMYGYGSYIEFLPRHRSQLLHLSEGRIMSIYNAELRSLATYFSLAESSHKLSKLYHLARASFLMTLACKSNTTVAKIAKRVKKNKQGKIMVVDNRDRSIAFIDLCEFLSK